MKKSFLSNIEKARKSFAFQNADNNLHYNDCIIYDSPQKHKPQKVQTYRLFSIEIQGKLP